MLVLSDLGDLDQHDTGGRHPERPERLRAVRDGIRDAVGDEYVTVAPRAATADELGRVHAPDYVRAVDELCAVGGGAIDADTRVSAGSCATARLAAGAGLAVVEELTQRG